MVHVYVRGAPYCSNSWWNLLSYVDLQSLLDKFELVYINSNARTLQLPTTFNVVIRVIDCFTTVCPNNLTTLLSQTYLSSLCHVCLPWGSLPGFDQEIKLSTGTTNV